MDTPRTSTTTFDLGAEMRAYYDEHPQQLTVQEENRVITQILAEHRVDYNDFIDSLRDQPGTFTNVPVCAICNNVMADIAEQDSQAQPLTENELDALAERLLQRQLEQTDLTSGNPQEQLLGAIALRQTWIKQLTEEQEQLALTAHEQGISWRKIGKVLDTDSGGAQRRLSPERRARFQEYERQRRLSRKQIST